MKVHLFFVRTGYVESGSTGMLTLFHSKGFGSIEEALTDFGACLIDGLRNRFEYNYKWNQLKQCCRQSNKAAAVRNKEGWSFCPVCGARLECEFKLEYDDLCGAVSELLRSDADSGGELMESVFESGGWDLWLNVPRELWKDAVHIFEHGDTIIGHLMTDPGDEENPHVREWHHHMDYPEGMKLWADSSQD